MTTVLRGRPHIFVQRLYDATAAAPDSRHTPRMSNLQSELNGYPVHALGLLIRLDLLINKVAATMPGDAPGERGYNAIGSLRVGIGNGAHLFVRDVRGSALALDSKRICGFEFGAGYGVFTDADATNQAHTREIFVPFAHRPGVAGAEDDGAIPIAAFGDSDLQLQIGSAGALGTGITLVSCGISVDVVCAPRHKLLMPTAWQVREETTTETIAIRPIDGFLHYLEIADLMNFAPAANGNFPQGIRLTIDNAIGPLHGFDQYVRAHNFSNLFEQKGGFFGSFNAEATSQAACKSVPLVPNYGDLITKQPRGPVKIETPGRVAASMTLVYRTNGYRTEAYMDAFLRRFGTSLQELSMSGGVLEVQSARGGAPNHLIPSLPAAVRWPSIPFAALRENAALRER